jgi:gliding motility-associated lipoprotein GldD
MKLKNKGKIIYLSVIFAIFYSCGDEIAIPKPATYLRLDLPQHEYVTYKEKNCDYSFEYSKIYKVSDVYNDLGQTCHKDINLGPLNGIIHFSFLKMDKPLGEYIDFAIDKVEEHKVKASAIEDSLIIRPQDRVYGTFFELQGDVASPFQFYLTDSVSKFVSGVVYLNKTPKYDSLKPSLEYLKVDLYQMLKTFSWE